MEVIKSPPHVYYRSDFFYQTNNCVRNLIPVENYLFDCFEKLYFDDS